MEDQNYFEDRIGLQTIQKKVTELKKEMAKVIIGQEELINLMIVSLLANGHVLIEGVPGIAKTLVAKLMARLISAKFSRIQFTPDLMPSDVTGTNIYNAGNSKFEFNSGPIFANIVLIDEINRAPAKTQSALFEVMEERQVSVDGTTYKMNPPFLVFATQNPLEHEGTYRLPEAQLDRFLFRILVDYPSVADEFTILKNADIRKGGDETEGIEPLLTTDEIIRFQKIIQQVHIEDHLIQYIAEMVSKTRKNTSLYLGASPRASINILIASKAFAAVAGRDFVIPEDIKAMMRPCLNHRISLTPEKEMEGITESQVINDIINSVQIPR